ncbi:DUF3857 domain-containing transglutaminase family protein [Lysobacter antibioticus]|uniref:Transglutaminase-like superfamily protein n=1 Tax=Lysobacter antibioticus TaxID=84531 RepID=A0A0S2FBT1_LYSAN|nr:DUF3857 and transglutaminase domain-containing protein [Lysobacter antibioticus]ALN80990.1 transglutaminase-like superfamily protein [Lysobacter antibioticus]
MRMITLRLSAAICFVLGASVATAQTAPSAGQAKTPAGAAKAASAKSAKEEPLRNERLHLTYTVQPDGAYIEQRESAIKVLQEAALEYVKHESVSYSASIQTLDILEAYTRKADGRRIDVPKSNFQVETNDGREGGGPAFSDIATTSLVYPDLAVGDTVVLSYKLTGKKPMFEGHFSDITGFDADHYQGDMRIKIDAPAGMWTQKRSFGALKQVRDETVGDRQIVEWSFQNLDPVESKDKNRTIYDIEQSTGYAYSTFRTYGDIAKAYGERALPKAVPTPRVRKLADEIAAGKSSQRDVAQALYEWVSTNISYAGNCIGLGAVVPRDQEFVIDNRIGDCKDHATLLQALLAAKGIEATQALINAGNVYKLPSVPVASSVNHVLNYLPGLDLYIDATAKGIPFGELPISIAGKPVLRIDRPELAAKTPGFKVLGNRQRVSTQISVLEDGSMKGKVEVELAGVPAIVTRAGLKDLSAEDAKELVKKVFERGGLSAEGVFTQDDPKPLRNAHRYSATFDVKQALPVPGAFPLGPVFFNPMPVASLVGSGTEETRDEAESTCTGGRSEEIYRIEFPATMKVIAVPPNLSLESGGSRYVATYTLKGNVLEASRVIEDATVGPVCSSEYNQAYDAFTKKVLPNLKAQVVYQ